MRDARSADDWIRDLVRACAYAITTAEFGLSGRIPEGTALEAVAIELDAVLESAGLELRSLARLEAPFRLRSKRQLAPSHAARPRS